MTLQIIWWYRLFLFTPLLHGVLTTTQLVFHWISSLPKTKRPGTRSSTTTGGFASGASQTVLRLTLFQKHLRLRPFGPSIMQDEGAGLLTDQPIKRGLASPEKKWTSLKKKEKFQMTWKLTRLFFFKVEGCC